MKKPVGSSRVLLVLSAILLGAAFIIAQEPVPEYRPTTVTIQNLAFGPDGSPALSEVSTYTFRSDGSKAQEWIITRLDSGEIGRGRTVRDFGKRLETTMMYDLGVSVSRMIPEHVVRNVHKFTRSCRSRAEQIGVQEGDDPFQRRDVRPDGEVRVQRFAPELGCKVVEFTVYSSSGRLVNSQKILRSTPGTDESLFRPDPSLKPVTWSDLAEAHAGRYGESFSERSKDALRALDERNPPLLEHP